MKLREKLLKNSTISETSLLSESKYYHERDMVPTAYPMINVALSGSIHGGLCPGITQLAGPSKHFKTLFGLLLVGTYLNKYPESVCLFYNSEFGMPESYVDQFNIDMERVVESPIINIEKLKHDVVRQLEQLERGEKVIVFIDSIGNLASLKEMDDALAAKSVAEVGSRAKALKSLFRMMAPYFPMKDIPCVVVNHSYQTLELYSKQVVSGGTGSYYSSDNIWMIGRQQEKEDKELVGYNFIINVEKSRYVKEKSKIPINVTFEEGIKKWSGMLDLALEANKLTKVGRSYFLVDEDGVVGTKKYSADDVEEDDFWNMLLKETNFENWIQDRFSLRKETK